MSLSAEMESYITTGLCPHCRTRILSVSYVNQTKWLRGVAESLVANGTPATDSLPKVVLVPRGAKAKITASLIRTGVYSMQCLTCMKTWVVGLRSNKLSNTPGQFGISNPPNSNLTSGTPPSVLRSRRGYQQNRWTLSAPASEASKRLDLSGCSLIKVIDERNINILLPEERNVYRNDSSGTVTQETSISNSITRTVTTESSKLTAHNANAGITFFGFATIQGHVEQQLSQRYSVALGSTSSISKTSSVSIPPYRSIVHVIQWKIIARAGTALLGKQAWQNWSQSTILAQIPYQVRLRLSYDDYYTDVDPVKKKGKRS